MWIDSHCHLDAPEFDADRAEVIARARAAGVGLLVIPSVTPATFATVRDAAEQCNGVYALGIHPLYVDAVPMDAVAQLADALQRWHDDPRLVAVGEIGLDYFVPGLDAERQQRFYREQLVLARRFDLPVILHVRRSADQLLKALRQVKVRGGIAHAFNGSLQQAQAFIALGFKLGFGGAVTYDRALQLRRLAADLPLGSLVMETDSPDIPPHWLYTTAAERAEGQPQGRNTPAELPRIAQVVADLRGMAVADLAQATTANACAALPGLQKLLHQNGL